MGYRLMGLIIAAVTFDSDADKDAGASEMTNGMMDLILANLAAGIETDSGRVVHYDSRTGLADPNAGIVDWAFPDTTDHRLPLPPDSLVASMTAITQALESLSAPPTGCLQSKPVKASPSDPAMQFGMTNPGVLSWEHAFINVARNIDNPHTNNDIYPRDLIANGDMDSNANMVSFPSGAFLFEETVFNKGVGYTADMNAAMAKTYKMLWDDVGEIIFRYSCWTNQAGSGSGKTASLDFDLFSIADIQTQSPPVFNRTVLREDWEDIYYAGQDINPNFARIHKQARVIRFMDFNNTNYSAVTSADQIPPRSYQYWAHNGGPSALGIKYDYSGPPLEVMVEMCNFFRCHMHYCIPQNMDDASIAAIATYVKANLAPDLAFLPEYSNESWNSLFSVFFQNHLKGLDLFYKATLNAGSGYAEGDQVYVRNGTNNITAATNGDPGVFTYSGSLTIGFEDYVYISGLGGMTEVNGTTFRVVNLDTEAKTFSLADPFTNEWINTTAFGTYTSGGTMELCEWVLTVNGVDGSGIPNEPMTIIRRSRATATDNLDVDGGTGAGMNITVAEFASTDFPTNTYSAFRATQMADIVRTVYGVDFGTRARPVLGIQTRNPGMWNDQLLVGFNAFANGMGGHPDYPTGSGDVFSDLFYAICGTNYVGPSISASLQTEALEWIAVSQAEFDMQLVARQQADLDLTLATCLSWKGICDDLGVKFGTYEGGPHNNHTDGNASIIAALAAYNRSSTGTAFLASTNEQLRPYFGTWITDFNLIGTDTAGHPWYALRHEYEEDSPLWKVVKSYNESNSGAEWDTISAAVDFSTGPAYGVEDYGGLPKPCADLIMFGGRCSTFNGDGTNLAIMIQEGVTVNCSETWLPGIAADYVATYPDVNGCVNLKRAGIDFFGHRAHPSKGGDFRFMDDYSRVAVSSYVS
jgi:hypothetical protein